MLEAWGEFGLHLCLEGVIFCGLPGWLRIRCRCFCRNVCETLEGQAQNVEVVLFSRPRLSLFVLSVVVWVC